MPGADRPRRTGNLTRDEKLGKLGPEGIRKQKAENAAFRAARKELNRQLATGLKLKQRRTHFFRHLALAALELDGAAVLLARPLARHAFFACARRGRRELLSYVLIVLELEP